MNPQIFNLIFTAIFPKKCEIYINNDLMIRSRHVFLEERWRRLPDGEYMPPGVEHQIYQRFGRNHGKTKTFSKIHVWIFYWLGYFCQSFFSGGSGGLCKSTKNYPAKEYKQKKAEAHGSSTSGYPQPATDSSDGF